VNGHGALAARLWRLWDADVLGIALVSGGGRLLDANDTLLRTIGYTRAELDAAPLAWPGTAPLRDGHPAAETELLHRDGHRVPVLVGAAAASDDSATDWLAFVHDLTDRKQLEAQVLQAQRLESVGLLAGGIAHDLNNVLSAILLYGDCVEAQLPGESSARDDLAEIRRAAQSARNIARQLLAFSSQQVLSPRLLEVGGVAAGLESMLRRLLGEDIQLVVHATARRQVLADLGQLEQVVLNLAVNARDAMPDGGVLTIAVLDLEVTAAEPRPGLPPGRYVELRVTDTGCGIDEATLRRIFEPFFTTKPKGRGTGLGLSTVFGIARQSGGAVWAESAPGRGSTFHFALPASDRVASRLRSSTSGTPRSGARGETILVVDDDASIARGVQRALDKAGYRVLVATSPGDALLVAEQAAERIALVISDVVMPMLSGPRLCERLRAGRPGLRTLLVTGYAPTVAAERGGPLEPLAVLAKPFTSVELLAKVREVLEA
jgi:signal transduction histidine kinase